MRYNPKLEQKIEKLGFKRKWFQDRSGYWYIKPIEYKDLKLNIYIEVDRKYLGLQVKTANYISNELKSNKYYDDVKKYELTLGNIKKLIKRYK